MTTLVDIKVSRDSFGSISLTFVWSNNRYEQVSIEKPTPDCVLDSLWDMQKLITADLKNGKL